MAFADPLSTVSVWPLYGPRAGGTRVTISGQFVNAYNMSAVFFGENKGYMDSNRLSCPLLDILLITLLIRGMRFIIYGVSFCYTGWAKKVSLRSLHVTSSNTGRFSKFFHCHILQEICNKLIIKH